jgi:uncharacterized Zn finger protein
MTDDRDGWRRFERGPRQPPPKEGIRMKQAGTTWWGLQWIEALERMSSSYGGRLARGKTYARAGRTHDLIVAPGLVTARVTGTRPAPYEVRIALAPLGDDTWAAAIGAMAKEARFSAELLAGRMPEAIDAAFAGAGASLFPSRVADLVTTCSCPDAVNPCKHVAATHYVLGEALDRDPFLLFELRGRSRDEVLDALRAARARTSRRKARSRGAPASEATVSLVGIDAATYDRPRERLPVLHLAMAAPAPPAVTLAQLGLPPGWSETSSPAEELAPALTRAAEAARRALE